MIITAMYSVFLTAAVQIYYTGYNHWVTSDFDGKEVRLYDSLVGCHSLTSSLEEQLVRIYEVTLDRSLLTVTRMPMQQQDGQCDCGVFSIANAYHAARGDDISRLHYDQSQMRKHLINCFEREELSPFPVVEEPAKTNLKRVICRKKHLFVHTYCVCGQPEWYDSQMVQCEL